MSRLSVALLGNFEINGAREPFPAGRLRVLLAALALRPERVVVVDELVEQLWGDALPNAPRVTLRGCVKRLRRVLDDGEGTSVIRSAELEVPRELRLPSTARVSREVAGSAGVSDRTRER